MTRRRQKKQKRKVQRNKNILLAAGIAVIALIAIICNPGNGFKKTDELKGKVICVDAGHGGNDPGTQTDTRYESDENLEFACIVKNALEAKGATVIMTREDDTYVSLKERADIANNADADLFLCFHRNYYSYDADINGIEIYINALAKDSDWLLGNALKDRMEISGGMNIRTMTNGTADDNTVNWDVIKYTKMTASLIEMGFMSNDNDNKIFDKYKKRYAQAIACAVVDYFEEVQ
ncbi:MAG: N-acetylmuramoyl-L-alanine amidase [Eubacterium sp.]